jgi:anti-sigma regulatory factor (Ser/Thr protein kinase)
MCRNYAVPVGPQPTGGATLRMSDFGHPQDTVSSDPREARPMCNDMPTARLGLSLDAMAPGRARAFLREFACPQHGTGLVEDAAVLTSELVTNAVIHGGPPIELAIECTATGLEVRVHDGSSREPQRNDAAALDTHGRGILLVDELSDRWGVNQHAGDGKDVWFRVGD